MCGFAGEFCFDAARANPSLVSRMGSVLGHRGPDEAGEFFSPQGRCAMVFRRLRVIDLSNSHQPMLSEDGAVALSFNGEIYNYRELRRELESEGIRFQTQGDTEVLLQLYLRFGRECFSRLVGMFSVAIHDGRDQSLLLARDRLGQKPLWISPRADRILFASEAKALLQDPDVDRCLQPQAVMHYLTMGYCPTPMSIWTGIQKLCPSELLYVRANGSMERSRYWSIPNGPSEMPREQDWCELVRETLRDSVRLRMVADVPLGIFLSGGIDSAVITALAMQEAGRTGGVRTFTAGFEDPQYDERDDARRVAEFLGTDHCQQIVQPSPKTMLDWVVDHYDEPFGDSSAIPTFLVCRAAREHVTVALGGDGGDEVFGGYDRYRAMHWAQTMNPAEYALVRLTGGMAGCFPGGHERSARTRLARFARGLGRPPAVQYFLYRRLFGPDDLLRLLCPDFLGEDYFVDTPADWFSELYAEGAFRDEALNAQRHDLQTYLPDDLLVKTDIASMAVSLEWRAPMLDHRVVELGLQLPIKHKLDRRTGKKILHRAFADLLPESVWQCRKRGFGVPLADWLRGPMREEMVSTLRHSVVREAGILQDEALVGLMNDHLSGKRDYSHRLWALMVFCRWLVRHCS